jgi:hypothetical protein
MQLWIKMLKDELLIFFKLFAVAVKRGLKFNVTLARFSGRNLMVQGQHINNVFS